MCSREGEIDILRIYMHTPTNGTSLTGMPLQGVGVTDAIRVLYRHACPCYAPHCVSVSSNKGYVANYAPFAVTVEDVTSQVLQLHLCKHIYTHTP